MSAISAMCAFSQTESYTLPNVDGDNSKYTFDYKKTSEWGTYKALRAVGWSALGLGVPTTVTGVFAAILGADGSTNPTGKIVFLTGVSLTAASIPLLATAYYYRHKAKKMHLTLGATGLTSPGSFNRADLAPGLALTLRF